MKDDGNIMIESKIEQLKIDSEDEKEEKFVNLMIEIIVSITLNQLHEESD